MIRRRILENCYTLLSTRKTDELLLDKKNKVSLVILHFYLKKKPYILDSRGNFDCSHGEEVIDDYASGPFDLKHPLLAVLSLDTVLVVVLEEAVKPGTVDYNLFRVYNAKAPGGFTAIGGAMSEAGIVGKTVS